MDQKENRSINGAYVLSLAILIPSFLKYLAICRKRFSNFNLYSIKVLMFEYFLEYLIEVFYIIDSENGKYLYIFFVGFR